ncbi:recombinase family protein [Enterococcus sp. BWB1-3]|uniref:recombinase family protein n=1 Tax=Enterococcus sp. BWB1-3 TaxID=2787713 RepID=UPI001920920E|nr:recombinase family protein [Enterococcus sp. BWB1-3]MBL1228026.1 recombinase family protein [Enterococcus sp. BWB1-3]
MVKKENLEKKIIKIGYCRVSTDDKQEMSLENQIKMMEQQNCNHVYSEHGSGRNDKRIEFQKMLKHIKKLANDEKNTVYLIVFKNDRLSRKFRTLVNTIEDLMELGVNYISLIDHIDTSSIGGKMFFQILSSFNEYEVSNTRERVKIGLERAREKGKILGRPSVTKSQKNKLIRLYQLNSLSVEEIAKKCNMKTSTAYKYLKMANIQRRR